MGKNVVENCKKITMSWLKKHGYLNGLSNGGIQWTNSDGDKSGIGFTIDTDERYIRFQYIQTDYWTDEESKMDYQFRLSTTNCYYGGVRYWFICGLFNRGIYCGRRVSNLYKPPGAKWFGCRHCWYLSYYERQLSYGGKYGWLWRYANMEERAENLRETIKRWYWQHRPTKKHKRLLRYYNML